MATGGEGRRGRAAVGPRPGGCRRPGAPLPTPARPATLTPAAARLPKLGRQLAEARKPLLPHLSLPHRRLHRAARLRVVSAVAESASAGERHDIVERLTKPVLGLPEPDLAHAR